MEVADVLARLAPRILGLRGAPELTLGASAAPLPENYRILVTGAGGSVGSALALRFATRLRGGRLFAFDQDDIALQKLARSVGDSARLALILGNTRDDTSVREAFGTARPHLVVHCAALKHVDLLEAHPREGYLTNVIGSLNVFEAARRHDSAVVNLSSDKAPDLASVLGCTKHLAERLLAGFSGQSGFDGVSLRLGNILGSRGSAAEVFISRALAGQALEITNGERGRYFMTLDEVISLIEFVAANPASQGACLAPVIGGRVKIRELAEAVVEVAGGSLLVHPSDAFAGSTFEEVMIRSDEVSRPDPREPRLLEIAIPPISPEDVLRLQSRGGAIGLTEIAHLARAGLPEMVVPFS